MGEQLAVDCQVLHSHLVEDVPIVLVVLVKDQSYVRACELEVQCIFLSLLEGGLHVVVRSEVPQATVLPPTAQFYKHLHHAGDLVLMEEQLQTTGADGKEELDSDSLRVLAIDTRLPALTSCCQIADGVSGVFAGDAVYAVLELTHEFELVL